MSPASSVKLDTAVTYRVYLTHRLPPSKSSARNSTGTICACRTARDIQVPKSQQRLVLRRALADAASATIASHHALPADSFTVAIDRAIILWRRRCATKDQNLPGIDVRSGGDGDGDGDGDGGWASADEAIRFWESHGAAVPVWVEFLVRTPPAKRGHAFTLVNKPVPPKGTEIAVHQALVNEEALLRQPNNISSSAPDTMSGSTTSESSSNSTEGEEI